MQPGISSIAKRAVIVGAAGAAPAALLTTSGLIAANAPPAVGAPLSGLNLLGTIAAAPLGLLVAWKVSHRLGVSGGGVAGIATTVTGAGLALAGAMVGRSAPRAIDATLHPDEYARADERLRGDLQAVRQAYEGLGVAPSILEGLPVIYDRSIYNAFHDRRTNEVLIGRSEGSGKMRPRESVAHEVAHAVTHGMTSLWGWEGRAVDESIADTLAATMDDDWVQGELPELPNGLRRMDDPRFGYHTGGGNYGAAPATRAELDEDNDPHVNMAVASLVAVEIGEALGRETMGRLYVAALGDPTLKEHPTFVGLAAALRASARSHSPAAFAVVDAAWTRAGFPPGEDLDNPAVSSERGIGRRD